MSVGRIKNNLVDENGDALGTAANPVRTDTTNTTPQAVTGPLTDAQLRATAVPTSVASLPLPAGAATETTLASLDTNQGTTADADTANTVIGRLKQVITRLAGGLPAALSAGGALKASLQDATTGLVAQVFTTNSINRLRVEAKLSSQAGDINAIQIQDGSGSGRTAYVDSANRLVVTANATIVPPSSVAVEQAEMTEISGTVDLVYVIPSGKVLTITRLAGGSQGSSGKVSKVSLFDDPAGNGTGMATIRSMYVSSTNYEYGLDYKITGDGTKAVRLRRERLDGSNDEVAGFWSGFRDT